MDGPAAAVRALDMHRITQENLPQALDALRDVLLLYM